MNSTEYVSAVEKAVNDKKIAEALKLLKVMLPADNWELRREFDEIDEDYRRLLSFLVCGPDPSRDEQLARVVARIFTLLDKLQRHKLIMEHSSLYFNVLRTLRLRHGETLAGLIDEYILAAKNVSVFSSASLSRSEIISRRKKLEDLEHRIFERLWVTTPLSIEEIGTVEAFIAGEDTLPSMKLMAVSALTLSLLQYFNEKILTLLLRIVATSGDIEVQVRATVGSLLVMARWPYRSNTDGIRRIVETLREEPNWKHDLEQSVMQITRTANVEKISKTMRDEIIPEIMNLRPDIEQHIRNSGIELSDIESNPEWEELLDKSGLSERLRKLSEMQMEGGDMFYTVFSMLKSYPFFSLVSNWFRPFEPEQSDAATALGHDTALGLMLADSRAMCGSDKYSFVLSIDRLPGAQKQMVLRQLSEANIAMAVESSDMIPEQDKRKIVLTHYIQELFRFFRLFRRSGEFDNPFAKPVVPVSIPVLKPDFSDSETLRLLGEFYFKQRRMTEAIDIFRLLPPDLALHQKMGYAYQSLGMVQEAVTEYERAELLAPDSLWTLRRLSQLYRTMGEYDKALELYKRIEPIEPDRPANALAMGHCYLRLNRPDEALNCYFKAEILDESSTKSLRPIAWSAFLTHDFMTAEEYYQKISRQLSPIPEDYINMGYLALSQNDFKKAIEHFGAYHNKYGDFCKAVLSDLDLLRRFGIGIDLSLIRLIADYLNYFHEEQS